MPADCPGLMQWCDTEDGLCKADCEQEEEERTVHRGRSVVCVVNAVAEFKKYLPSKLKSYIPRLQHK